MEKSTRTKINEADSKNLEAGQVPNYQEEFGAEFTVDSMAHNETSAGRVAGSIALFASIIALFVYPMALGIIAIILGCFATMKGAKTLGITATIIGIVAAGSSLMMRTALFSLFY